MSYLTPLFLQLIAAADAPSAAEHATTRCYEYLFSRLIFKGDEWVMSSQQPPTLDPNDRRRVDIVIEKFLTAFFKRLLYFEGKKGDASQTEMVEVEYQGFTAGLAHCEFYNEPSITIMTAFGSRARLWVYRRGDDYLTALYPLGDGVGARNEYAALSSTEGQILVKKLKYLRDHELPAPDHLIPSNCSPRPSNVSLPTGWELQSTSSMQHHAPTSHGQGFNPTPYAQGASNLQNPSSYSLGFTTNHLESSTDHQMMSIAQSSTSHTTNEQVSEGASPAPYSWGPVDVWRHHRKYRFNNMDGKVVETEFREWEYDAVSSLAGHWVYKSKITGIRYFAKGIPGH